MGKWGDKPKKNCCEYYNFRENHYCIEPISKTYPDTNGNKFCIFHSNNSNKQKLFYRKINKEIEDNNSKIKEKIDKLKDKRLSEQDLIKEENNIRDINLLQFMGYIFPDDVNFSNIQFEGTVNFWGAKFNKNVRFINTILKSKAIFYETEFLGNVILFYSNFNKETFFTNSIFYEELNYNSINVKEYLDFTGVIFQKRVTFFNTDLSKVSFRFAELHNSIFHNITYSNLTLNKIIMDTFTENTNRVFARDAADYNYLVQKKESLNQEKEKSETFKDKFKIFWKLSLFKLWGISSDYGRSFWRWLFWCFVIALFFGGIYTLFLLLGWIYIDPNTDPDIVAPFYYSIVTFTTLGFGDIVPVNWVARLCVLVEVILGYLMLGGLISILANKFARRA